MHGEQSLANASGQDARRVGRLSDPGLGAGCVFEDEFRVKFTRKSPLEPILLEPMVPLRHQYLQRHEWSNRCTGPQSGGLSKGRTSYDKAQSGERGQLFLRHQQPLGTHSKFQVVLTL